MPLPAKAAELACVSITAAAESAPPPPPPPPRPKPLQRRERYAPDPSLPNSKWRPDGVDPGKWPRKRIREADPAQESAPRRRHSVLVPAVSLRYRTTVRQIALVVGAVTLLVAGGAGAQSTGASNRAAAEALFNAGRSLAASGKYAEACPKFEASQQLDPGLGTLLNLAECYEKLGKTASAWAEYREAIPLARASGSKVRQDLATERAAALESRLSTLTIRAMGGTEEANGLEIRRDGLPVQPAELGSPIPVDPGPHTIEAAAPGKQKWSSTVQIADASKLAVEVPALKPLASEAPPPLATKPVEVPPLDQSSHSGSAQRTAGIVVGAAGVVSVGIGAVFGLSASSQWSDAKSKCSAYPYGCSQESLDEHSSAQSKASLATVLFIVGGAAIAGGTVLWLTAGSGQEKTVAVGVGPGAAFVRGSF